MTFAEFCAGYFKNYFEIHPTEAIYYGIEGYDHLLNDFSDQTYNTEKALVEKSLSELREIPSTISTEMRPLITRSSKDDSRFNDTSMKKRTTASSGPTPICRSMPFTFSRFVRQTIWREIC
jgi:hypothetical protein